MIAACIGALLLTAAIVGAAFGHSIAEEVRRHGTPRPTPAIPSPDRKPRLWTIDWTLLAEIDDRDLQSDEGLVLLDSGSTESRPLRSRFDDSEIAWLTVDGPEGRWIGRLDSITWSARTPWWRTYRFHPLAEPAGAGWTGWPRGSGHTA